MYMHMPACRHLSLAHPRPPQKLLGVNVDDIKPAAYAKPLKFQFRTDTGLILRTARNHVDNAVSRGYAFIGFHLLVSILSAAVFCDLCGHASKPGHRHNAQNCDGDGVPVEGGYVLHINGKRSLWVYCGFCNTHVNAFTMTEYLTHQLAIWRHVSGQRAVAAYAELDNEYAKHDRAEALAEAMACLALLPAEPAPAE